MSWLWITGRPVFHLRLSLSSLSSALLSCMYTHTRWLLVCLDNDGVIRMQLTSVQRTVVYTHHVHTLWYEESYGAIVQCRLQTVYIFSTPTVYHESHTCLHPKMFQNHNWSQSLSSCSCSPIRGRLREAELRLLISKLHPLQLSVANSHTFDLKTSDFRHCLMLTKQM